MPQIEQCKAAAVLAMAEKCLSNTSTDIIVATG